MKLSLHPFPQCAWIRVPLTPLGYCLFVAKLYAQVPRFVPEEDFYVTVFIDLPEGDPEEGLMLIRQHLPAIQRLAAEWIISPANMN